MPRKRNSGRATMGQLTFVLSIASVMAAGALVWASISFFRSEFPDVALLKSQFPRVTYKGKKQPPEVTLQRSRPAGWVGLGEISKVAVGAVLVSEDWAFYQHKGYDAQQIKEAMKENWEEGRYARGASTITQQVVRNVFLTKEKNLWRKLKELYLAVKLEGAVGKRKILETYLNIAEWGEGIFGIHAAAQHYFHKHPSGLTAKEGAFLAMLLPSPKRYGQSFRKKELTPYAYRTINSILNKLRQAQYLSMDERDLERAERLSFELPPESDDEMAPVDEENSTEEIPARDAASIPDLLSEPASPASGEESEQ